MSQEESVSGGDKVSRPQMAEVPTNEKDIDDDLAVSIHELMHVVGISSSVCPCPLILQNLSAYSQGFQCHQSLQQPR